MIIEVIDGYELRCIDGINWQVFQFKDREVRGSDKKRTGVFEKQWVGLPSYHGTVAGGVTWILNNIPKKKSNLKQRKTLEQFLKDMQSIERKIAKSASRIEGAINHE